MKQTNEERIKNGLGWVELGKSQDEKYVVYAFREKLSIWKPNPKDRILRIVEIDKVN